MPEPVQALIFDCFGVIYLDDGFDAELLEYILQLKSHYKIGMLSNVGKGSLQRLFAPEVLATHFDVALSSGDIGIAKPRAGAFATVAEQLGVPPEHCIMIDDTPAYCTAARAAGMQAIDYWSLLQLRRELAQLGIVV